MITHSSWNISNIQLKSIFNFRVCSINIVNPIDLFPGSVIPSFDRSALYRCAAEQQQSLSGSGQTKTEWGSCSHHLLLHLRGCLPPSLPSLQTEFSLSIIYFYIYTNHSVGLILLLWSSFIPIHSIYFYRIKLLCWEQSHWRNRCLEENENYWGIGYFPIFNSSQN